MDKKAITLEDKLQKTEIPPIGVIALHYGTISMSKLKVAIESYKHRQDKGTTLEDILLAKGMATEKQIYLLKSLGDFYIARNKSKKFGDIAIEKGFATQAEVENAMEIQIQEFRQNKLNKLIGDILVEQGIITEDQRNQIIKEQHSLDNSLLNKHIGTHDNNPEISPFEKIFLKTKWLDERFAKAVLDKGFAHKKDIIKAFHLQKRIFSKNQSIKLVGEILIEDNIISAEQCTKVLKEQGRSDETNKIQAQQSPEIIIAVSNDNMSASLKVKKDINQENISTTILDALRKKEITHGIINSQEMLQKVIESSRSGKPFIAATGRKPVPGNDAAVKYYFNKKSEDPESKSLEVPARFVLAQKTPLIKARDGFNILGEPIKCESPLDIHLKPGEGTTLSDDGLILKASVNGFPKISINDEISIYQNVIIDGSTGYRESFSNQSSNIKVKGTLTNENIITGCDLEADEIRRAHVDVAGDIETYTGITDAEISTEGGIKAKYIHNSKIDCFGDIIIENEIIDSEIITSGRCITEKSKIISSYISAKKGISAMGIGTITSEPCHLTLGTDEHIEKKINDIEVRKMELKTKLKQMHTDKMALDYRIKTLTKKCVTSKKEYHDLKQQEKDNSENNLAYDIDMHKKHIKQAAVLYNQMLSEKQKKGIELKEIISKIPEMEKDVKENLIELNSKKKSYHDWIIKVNPIPKLIVKGKTVSGTKISGSFLSMKLNRDYTSMILEEKESKRIIYKERTLTITEQ